MNNNPPISVQILTWNSGKTLRRTLKSVRGLREIILIDGGSTDDTLAIGKEFGAHVVAQRPPSEQGRPLTDFAAARNVGLHYTTERWILALDSDEVVSQELFRQITAIVERGEPCACYLPRKYVRPDGIVIQHASTYPNERIYFFHRSVVRSWVKPVHERALLLPGTRVQHLRGATLAPLPTIEEFKEKNRQYLAIERERSRELGFGHWFWHRLFYSLRSSIIALMKLAWIWLLPHRRPRLPLRHEALRFWYRWRLIIDTFPRHQ